MFNGDSTDCGLMPRSKAVIRTNKILENHPKSIEATISMIRIFL